jgi:archaeal flagellin FlaB
MISRKFKDEGFTGLEAAIVLIAFVVVAAVFSYVVLGAGFFTTQKSQEVVHTGVQQASSTLQVVGDVYGTATGNTMDAYNFTISLAPGGTPVDISKMTITFSTAGGGETLVRNPTFATTAALITAGSWGVVGHTNDNSNWLLEKDETFTIMVHPTTATAVNTQINIDLKPVVGAALGISRTTPAAMHPVNILY